MNAVIGYKKINKTINKTNMIRIIVLLPIITFFALPIYICVINSFKGIEEIVRYPLSLGKLTLGNYVKIFTSKNFNVLTMYYNSIVVTAIALGLTLLTSPIGGYYIARANKKIGQLITMFLLIGWMIPPQITLIPLISLLVKLKLMGTFWSLFIAYGGNVFATILYSKFMTTIPVELEEAASIEGAGKLTIFTKIIIPLLKPVTATTIIFVGLGVWNDFLTPLMLLKNFKTITFGIFVACNTELTDYGFVSAFVMLAAVPVVIVFISLQSKFMDGLIGGATKG